MDSLSQLVLGASVGEWILGKKIGNKALFWGAIAGTIPDLDVLTRPFLDIVEEVAFHRSISHSLFLFLILAPGLGWLLKKTTKESATTFWDWTNLFFWGFLTHALLDCFTTWGTQLFWPLEKRIAWKTIFVVDPLYTLPFLGFLIALAFKNKQNPSRRLLNGLGLMISCCYLSLTLVNKSFMNKKFNRAAHRQNIGQILSIDTRPAPLQNILWTANVETKNHFWIFYSSYFDRQPQPGYSIPKNHELLAPYLHDGRVQKLLQICEGYYTLSKTTKGVILNDLRFGQSQGWVDKESPFVFAYHIYPTESGVQITEVAKEYRKLTQSIPQLWKRVRGEF